MIMIFLHFPSALHDILYTPVALLTYLRYSLFMLKVPLNTKQTNKPRIVALGQHWLCATYAAADSGNGMWDFYWHVRNNAIPFSAL